MVNMMVLLEKVLLVMIGKSADGDCNGSNNLIIFSYGPG